MKSKDTYLRLLVFLPVMALLSFNKASAQPVEPKSTWAPGRYDGWVLFEGAEHTTKTGAIEELTYYGDGGTHFYSIGTLTCNVGKNGNGFCKAAFPMDISHVSGSTISVPDCSIFVSLYMRAEGMSASPSASGPIGNGFSLMFKPSIGESYGHQGITGSGDEDCRKDIRVDFGGRPPIQFPSGVLRFRVGGFSKQAVDGTCSMDGLPSHQDVPMGPIVMSIDYSLETCQWMVWRVDTSTQPPKGR